MCSKQCQYFHFSSLSFVGASCEYPNPTMHHGQHVSNFHFTYFSEVKISGYSNGIALFKMYVNFTYDAIFWFEKSNLRCFLVLLCIVSNCLYAKKHRTHADRDIYGTQEFYSGDTKKAGDPSKDICSLMYT